MTDRIVAAALEAHAIHMATCRQLRQGLACSLCNQLADHAARVKREASRAR